jgi:hypothetical protein
MLKTGIDGEAAKYFKTILKHLTTSKFKLFDENTLALKSLQRGVCVSQQMAMIHHQGLKSRLGVSEIHLSVHAIDLAIFDD